ncbi:MAG TPA: PqqD family protein [Bdellovibrionota bacterium]
MQAAKMNESTKLRKSEQVHWKSVDGEAVLLHFVSGNYFALDKVGTFLWSSLCEKPKSIGDLVGKLMLEYDCTEMQARKDTLEFCGQLVAEKLLDT